jgi:hypothetical protein
MKSSEAFKKLIYKCNTMYGAPMGRSDMGEKPTNERIFKRRVYLDSGGYDSGSAYWGIGKPLFVEYNADLTYVRFYRSE